MNYAILLLAGSSNRFKDKTPKQFYKIKNKPLYFYPLEILEKSKKINGIILVVPKNKILEINNFTHKHFKNNKIKAIIEGGLTRTESVKNGLNFISKTLKCKKTDLILIHDAARPLIDEKIISKAISKTKIKKATIFAIKNNDTVVKTIDKKIKKYLDRENIFFIQTPQTFCFNVINNAYKNINIKTVKNSDDSELVFKKNINIVLLEGDKKLFKITYKNDIKILKQLLSKR
ncbi:MAG: 2-C-methyl-D-erythritol 4-phosphate cytidylyltransferase [Bacilli bacterium]|nr:2-C-methyl-D-erythritol 4-phosphate cytidylyltransferase [Bacilli bacterium]